MATFTPLWSTLVTSTIWQSSKETRVVWITLLAMKDREGVVKASVPGLANLANVTIPECEAALAELMAPDKYSSTRDNDGRRIVKVDGGWSVLNHMKYRNMMADRREYWREAKKKSRAASKKTKDGPLPGEKLYVEALERGDTKTAEHILDEVNNQKAAQINYNDPPPQGTEHFREQPV